MSRVSLPQGFHWGAASAATAIEGAVREDGRGESIWDAFCRRPGHDPEGVPDVASDAWRRAPEDVALLADVLHATSYRFSIAWPRIQPEGRGRPLAAGLDAYGRRVDALLERGIRPLVTLYHWDLPQALERRGGWPERDTAGRFADYTEAVVRALGDRVDDWILLNEPGTFTACGYGDGTHAPGRRDTDAFLRAMHVANLAQAEGFRAARAVNGRVRIGTAVALSRCVPHGDDEADRDAAERLHAFTNLWFLEPALRGRLPDAFLHGAPHARMGIREDDLPRLRAPFDFIGINAYPRTQVRAHADDPLGIGARAVPREPDAPREPEAVADLARLLRDHFEAPVLEVTAQGCAGEDRPDAGGVVHDRHRIDFHEAALAALARAIEDGADVRGYHAWSLLDGFAWSEGYRARHGLIHVDFPTGRRTPKASARWYGRVAAENSLET